MSSSSTRGTIAKSIMTAIAGAIRYVEGSQTQYKPTQMENAIKALKKTLVTKSITQNGTYNPASDSADGYSAVTVEVSTAPTLQSKTITPSGSQQTVQPDNGYDGLSSVVVNGDADLIAGNIKKDVEIFGVTGSYEGSGGGGGSSVDRSLLNFFFRNGTELALPVINGHIVGPFKNNSYFISLADGSGNRLRPNWSLPFEIFVSFKYSQTLSRSMTIFGCENNFYYCPGIELSSNGNGIWCGLSTNGTSWTQSISFRAADGLSLSPNTEITAKAIWDGTDYTVTINDGTNTITKSVSVSGSPVYSEFYDFEFGGVNRSSSHFAQYVTIDLDKTYIKSNGSLVWGCES